MKGKAASMPCRNNEFENRLFASSIGKTKQDSGGCDIVVIGASAGGVETLTRLVATFNPHLPAAFLVVMHLSAHARSVLCQLLERAGRLPARHPYVVALALDAASCV